MSSIDCDDDLIIFDIDDLEYRLRTLSDLSTSDCQSIDCSSLSIKSNTTKMSDITDLLDSTDLHDQQIHGELISTDIVNYLGTHNLRNKSDNYEKYQWETEEDVLRYESKQLSPNDYLTRTSLYNRPVAFEKDSRSWARSLLDNFQNIINPNLPSTSSSTHFPYYFSMLKKSASFDHHVQYMEHLNECNDYPAYLEYLRENRSELFYTLTDSIDLIDGLLGTVVPSF